MILTRRKSIPFRIGDGPTKDGREETSKREREEDCSPGISPVFEYRAARLLALLRSCASSFALSSSFLHNGSASHLPSASLLQHRIQQTQSVSTWNLIFNSNLIFIFISSVINDFIWLLLDYFNSVKTPGGKNTIQYIQKLAKGVKCGDCGGPIHGVCFYKLMYDPSVKQVYWQRFAFHLALDCPPPPQGVLSPVQAWEDCKSCLRWLSLRWLRPWQVRFIFPLWKLNSALSCFHRASKKWWLMDSPSRFLWLNFPNSWFSPSLILDH